MSDMLNTALSMLTDKLDTSSLDGTVKFQLNGEGAIVVDGDGVRISDDEADVTLSADPDVFKNILSGDQNPPTAFMTGKLSVDGDMGMAMKLASLLA
ncbi:MAG: SCP2 sterol-binding domain-containing protein [Pseudomonadota bacterium]